MFEKHRNNKTGTANPSPQLDNITASVNTPGSSGREAVIGPGIYINGDISGDENLLIEGKVDGKIRLEAHQVEVGHAGRVNADIKAKVIKIAGQVRGDLIGTEKVIISRSGNVHGNIVAPRMTLEDGAIFKGSIDMDPSEPVKVKISKAAKKVDEKTLGKPVETAKVIATDKPGKSNAYSLNGE